MIKRSGLFFCKLAFVGILNATVAVYYYLKVIVTLYMREPEGEELHQPVSPATATVILVSILGVLYLGLAPGRLLDLLSGLVTSLI